MHQLGWVYLLVFTNSLSSPILAFFLLLKSNPIFLAVLICNKQSSRVFFAVPTLLAAVSSGFSTYSPSLARNPRYSILHRDTFLMISPILLSFGVPTSFLPDLPPLTSPDCLCSSNNPSTWDFFPLLVLTKSQLSVIKFQLKPLISLSPILHQNMKESLLGSQQLKESPQRRAKKRVRDWIKGSGEMSPRQRKTGRVFYFRWESQVRRETLILFQSSPLLEELGSYFYSFEFRTRFGIIFPIMNFNGAIGNGPQVIRRYILRPME